MREMKDSGIPWIGKIPKDWNIRPFKFLLSLNTGGIWGNEPTGKETDKMVLRSTEQTIDGQWNIINPERRDFTALKYKKYRILPGDLIVTKSSGSSLHIGKTTLAGEIFKNEEYYYSNFMQRLRPISGLLNSRFAWYLMNSSFVRAQLVYMQNGTTGLGNIDSTDIGHLRIPVPSLFEQRRIADFLDAKCARIDSIRKNVEAEIEALKQYKQSVITEAVTKGLDKNVEMKDSGIPLIGKIPKDWNIIKIKYVASIIRGGSPRPIEKFISSTDDGFNWIKIGDTDKGSKYITHTSLKIIKAGLPKTRLVHEGTLLLTNSMSFGEPYILKIPGCIHDGWVAFFNYKAIDKFFLYYALLSKNSSNQFEKISDGGIVLNLNIDKIGNCYLALPDKIDTQTEIVNYLDNKCAKIDSIIQKKQELLANLDSYKKSLIYEYVTGKKEVPAV